MKKVILLVILAFSIALSPLVTSAAAPKVINYQGKLKGVTPNTPTLVVFEIFEDAAGGSALWIEQKSVTVDDNGLFSTYLGEANPISLKFDKQYYLQVTVGNNQPFPRTKLSSTPTAFYAVDADTAQYAFNAGLAADVAPKAIGLDNLADEVLTAGGDLTGMYPNPQIKPSAIIDNIPDGSITSRMLSPNISTSPSGPAGGDLTGTYPDPLIAVGAIKTDRLFDAAVTNEKIADGAVNDAKITDLDAAKLFNVSALDSRVAVSTDATIDGDGTLASPLGLADNAVSTPKIVDGAVTNAKIGADAVTSDKILDGTIVAADIATGAVTTDEILDETILAGDIATGAVTTDEILDETILAADIATGAVTTDEILDETILANDIATGAVTTDEILDATVATVDLADDAVTNAKLADDAVRVNNIDVTGAAPVNGDVLYFDGFTNEMRWGQENVETSAPLTGDGTTANPVTLDPTFGNADEVLIRTAPTGWVSGKINTANIADGAITNVKIAADAVTTDKIADGTIATADLADGSVTSAKILDGEVSSADIADGTIATADLADNSVTTAKILDGEVQTADIDDKAVTNAKLDENSVTGNKVVDGSLSSLDLNATGVTAGIYGDPSASPSVIDVPEIKIDAQGRILTAVENSYTVLAAGTIFNESPVSDVTVDGPYNNLDLQIKPGVVGTTELADGSVTSAKILDATILTADLADNSVTSAKIVDGTVTSADIADGTVANIDLAPNSVATGNIIDGTIANADLAANSVATANIIDNNVLNTKIGSAGQAAGQVLKADGAGNTVWGPDMGLILPYTGSYDGPGDAFTLTHTGVAGSGSVLELVSGSAANTEPAVHITKDVNAGAGAALAVTGTGVQGTNYIATITNTNLNEGRTLLLENDAPVVAAQITDPDAIPGNGDEFVTPDAGGTDVNDATLVVRNKDAASSNEKLAIKTYGSIQANSTIQGTNLVAYDGQITLYNSTTGATAVLYPPTAATDPLNITPGLDINGTSGATAPKGLTNIWDSIDGPLLPAGTGSDNDVPTVLAVSNALGSVAGEPFLTFAADGGSLTNNRVFGVNSTLTVTDGGADDAAYTLALNLANPNTWTGTQTLSAVGNGLVVTTGADFQGNIANSTGDVDVNDNLSVFQNLTVAGTSTLKNATTIGATGLAGTVLMADNSDAVVPTAVITNNGAGPAISATGNVTVTGGGLNVTGATDLNSGLNVDGASTLDAVTIAGTLNQSGGQVTLGGNVDANGGLDVTGATTLAGTVTQTGAGQVIFGGNVDANGGLDVTGATTLAGTVTQTGGGQVTLSGNVDANNGLDLVGTFGFDGESITNIDNTAEGLVSGDAGLPTSGNVASAISAVADAQFLTLANDGDLSNEMVFTPSANFTVPVYAANAPYTFDLSNTGVTAGSYGLVAGTTYPTYTVDGKGRLTAAGNQAIVVDDAVASDVTITGALSNALDLQIKTNAVGTNELATADYSGDLAIGNYVLGNLNNTVIGGTTPAAGTFTNLTAQTDITLTGTTVSGIATSADAPLTNDDNDLVTEGAVFTAVNAVADAQFLTLSNDNDLSGEMVFTPSANFTVPVYSANAPYSFDLSNTGVTAGSYGNNAGTHYSTFTVDGKGRITAAATQIIAVNDAGTGDIDITGATSATLNLEIRTDAVGTNELATADYSGDLATGNYVLGNLNNTVIGGTTPAAGTFTTLASTGNTNVGADLAVTGNTTVGGTLGVTGATTTAAVTSSGLITANAGLTVGVAQNFTLGAVAVNDIYTSADAVLPQVAATDAQLVTAKAVSDALNAQTLQTAYQNGNTITTSAAEGDLTINGTEDLNIGINTNITGTFGVTGATTLTGALTQSGAQVTFGGNVDANNGLDVVGGANVAGGVAVSSGGVTVTAGGVNIVSGDLTVGAGNANISSNATVGGIIDAKGTITNSVGNVTVNDNLVVTGTSDLQGVISNSTGDVAITDGVQVTLGGANSLTVTGSGTSAPAISVSAGTASAISASGNNAVSTISALNTGAGSAASFTNAGTGATNATITANNVTGASNAFAISVPEDGGHLQLSAESATTDYTTSATAVAINGNTVVRITASAGALTNMTLTGGAAAGQIVIVVNEDAANPVTFTGGNILSSTVVAAGTATQFVWTGAAWAPLN